MHVCFLSIETDSALNTDKTVVVISLYLGPKMLSTLFLLCSFKIFYKF